jgi:hypothetical protein
VAAALGATATLVFFVGRAHAADPPQPALGDAPPAAAFGDAGVVAISSDADLLAAGRVYYGGDDDFGEATPEFQLYVAPAADVFVARHLSLGGSFGVSWRTGEDEAAVALEPAIRLGYLFPFGRMALWPRVGAGYRLFTGDAVVPTPSGVVSVEYTQHDVFVSASVAFLVHAAPHFFVGLAPFGEAVLVSESVDVGAPPKPISFGLRLVLGGWW